ncbi:uncharacterized protein TRUGW13939_08529 [Talaromyces rugulosus]|uniref:Uncharacterized protein n=1 Tax=Talaromyces rugulosus TaxID=121627 RepID=A0A7H8R6M0_TALRU|nr:uncharacterized protein TRUGW13939_08529 [Talaromyces rugulosus]QKX61381.1 hypothetical protein TRUGW13939_08529 [Talaromyces rugulosus]
MDDPVQHSRKRRIIAQAVTTEAVKSMESIILGHVDQFCELLTPSTSQQNGTWSEPLDVKVAANCFTFDTLTDVALGRSPDMLTSEKNRWILSLLPKAVKFLHTMGHMPILLCLYYLPFKSQMAKDMTMYHQDLSEKIAQHRIRQGTRSDGDKADVLSYLINAKDPETGGADTTALAITAALFYLAQYPSSLIKLRTEPQQAFDSKDSIRMGPVLLSCLYLRACLDEAMRLVPAVGGVLPRTVLPPGLVIANEYCPPGTIVGVPGYAMNHHPEYFPEPFSFRPERWIVGSLGPGKTTVTEADVRRSQAAFLQFSQGPRGCVGKHLAYAELSLAVASVVWSFDMEVSNKASSLAKFQDRDDWREAMSSRGEIPTGDICP